MADTTTQKGMAIPLTAFAAGAVAALLIGVFGKVHDPSASGITDLGFDNYIVMKVWLSLVIGVLAVLQVIGALCIYGKLGFKAPSWVGQAHRISGTIVVLLTIFVGYHCLWGLGLETGENVGMRTVVHGVLGCAVFGAVVVKLVAVRSRRAPGWFLPVAGGMLFTLLVVVVLTSAAWYVGTDGWPSRTGY